MLVLPLDSTPTWIHEFLNELELFPAGILKDIVDASAHGYNWLARRGGTALQFAGSDNATEQDPDFQAIYQKKLDQYLPQEGAQ